MHIVLSSIKLFSLSALLIIVVSSCSSLTESDDDTMVIVDEKTGAVTFASKKHNPELADEDEFKKAEIREKERIEKQRRELGLTGPNPNDYSKASPHIQYGTDAPTDYEEYKRWRAASGAENSAEYQRFKLWQEFEDYRKWKQEQQGKSE